MSKPCRAGGVSCSNLHALIIPSLADILKHMNLPETQVAIRKILIAIVSITLFYYTGKFLITQGISIYNKLNPPEIPAPEAKFGVLPKLKMASIPIEGNPNYILDTVNGRLPNYSDRFYVYEITQPQTTLLSEQKIKKLAEDLGFTQGYTKLSSSQFRWTDGINSRTFEANAITKSFKLTTDTNKLSSVITNTSSITTNDAISMTTNFIKSKSLFGTEDTESIRFIAYPAQILYGKVSEIGPGTRSYKLIKLNVYRDIIAREGSKTASEIRYKILGPDPKNSQANFYVTNDGGSFKFPNIDLNYWTINYENKSQYYVSDINLVWDAIKQGKGIISHIKSEQSDYFDPYENLDVGQIEIRDVYIALYEPRELTPYLQPIYVFEGQFETTKKLGELPKKGEIIIYYPAVRGDFVK